MDNKVKFLELLGIEVAEAIERLIVDHFSSHPTPVRAELRTMGYKLYEATTNTVATLVAGAVKKP